MTCIAPTSGASQARERPRPGVAASPNALARSVATPAPTGPPMKESSLSSKRSSWPSLRAGRLLLALAGAPLGLAVAASFPTDVQAAGPTAMEVGTRVQKFYDSTKTFKATFKQTYTIKIQNVQKVSTGKVTFEKPGKMSWTYDAPNGNRVVSDGTTIKVYEKENEQMYETPVKKSQYPAALAFLMGQGQLIKDFKLRL